MLLDKLELNDIPGPPGLNTRVILPSLIPRHPSLIACQTNIVISGVASITVEKMHLDRLSTNIIVDLR